MRKLYILLILIFYCSVVPCAGNERIELYTLSTGDPVYRQNTCVVIAFKQPRTVLGTSVINGGYREDLKAIFNHDMKDAVMNADSYPEYMQGVARNLGLDPDRVSGMGTGASMDNVAIQSASYQTLTVTAIATGGVEENGGRVGDPAEYFNPGQKTRLHKPGTINIMLVIDADIPPGTLARALVTCTEAKTAALQELMAGSKYSSGLATGSGTDQTIIIANPGSPLYLEDAGKHSKLGELIGRTVKQAVKEALFRQTGLSPQKQHSVLRRMNRFGLTEETLYQEYLQKNGYLEKQRFLDCLQQLDKDPRLVTYTSLYVHLLDQFNWQLLSGDETVAAGNELLLLSAGKFGVLPRAIAAEAKLENCIQAWSGLVVDILRAKLAGSQGD
ncbi:MAG TPA: adenosylcobinamide amidohydrolase [Methylomusa anaerophila]|uniref:Adenosylcobinamide amidohydrolase n=1 Tax=Methylomusa anaerophila TaxID=1930071 RepID=A0A348AM75_9FIRM|nr:adenosylcobinamide amidohydrolase [Methylomusa anaerophila]BBB92173.1 adenosylcobinamide amidohydrolase [Methylomusa anaerophila]HML87813.1 adenosylcobinamide amidohydrolase [Methylomusa anaerophila]